MSGKVFEDLTSCKEFLLNNGFKMTDYFLQNEKQRKFNHFMKEFL